MPNQHKYKLIRPRTDLADQLPGGSDGVNPALARYLHLTSSPPEFSEVEWNLIRDACNGWASEMEPPEILLQGFALQVEDAIAYKSLDKKWGVDASLLVPRLYGLTAVEAIATIHAIEKWWDEQG